MLYTQVKKEEFDIEFAAVNTRYVCMSLVPHIDIRVSGSVVIDNDGNWPKLGLEYLRDQSEAQVNALVYSVGDQTDDILAAFKLSDEQQKQCSGDKFNKHFVKKHNVISECVQSEKTEGSGIR